MPCVYYNDGFYSYQKYHETRGVYYKHICSTCFAHEGKSSTHSAVEYRQNLKKRISLGMAVGSKIHDLQLTCILALLTKTEFYILLFQ